MSTATATAGYQLEETASGWSHLLHEDCGKWASFLNPTDERVRWYVVAHRCGPAGTEWHLSEPATDGHRSETPGATAGWLHAVSEYVETRPDEVFKNRTVWPALRELAVTLLDRFPRRSIGAPSDGTGANRNPSFHLVSESRRSSSA